MKKLIVYTDGGSRNNPGKAAAAFIIQNESGQILQKDGVFLGVMTNNEAEYAAVKLAFEKALGAYDDAKNLEIEVRCDSRLIVEQLKGSFKVKNPRMKIFVEEIKKLESRFGKIFYALIPRGDNSLADSLVNSILDLNS